MTLIGYTLATRQWQQLSNHLATRLLRCEQLCTLLFMCISREQCVTINEESYRKLLFENDTAVEGELEKLSAVLKKQENKCKSSLEL